MIPSCVPSPYSKHRRKLLTTPNQRTAPPVTRSHFQLRFRGNVKHLIRLVAIGPNGRWSLVWVRAASGLSSLQRVDGLHAGESSYQFNGTVVVARRLAVHAAGGQHAR